MEIWWRVLPRMTNSSNDCFAPILIRVILGRRPYKRMLPAEPEKLQTNENKRGSRWLGAYLIRKLSF